MKKTLAAFVILAAIPACISAGCRHPWEYCFSCIGCETSDNILSCSTCSVNGGKTSINLSSCPKGPINACGGKLVCGGCDSQSFDVEIL